MDPTESSVVGELKGLRRGRGLQSSDLSVRIGPKLRELLRLAVEDDALTRMHFTARLAQLSEFLPLDLRRATEAALGMGAYSDPLLQQRAEKLAVDLKRDVRTARRRMDEGLKVLASVIVRSSPLTQAPRANSDWYIAECVTIFRLDKSEPEALESRVIVSHRDGLDHLELLLTLPREGNASTLSPHDLHIEVMYGGKLVLIDRVTETLFRFHLELPHPLSAGERYQYGMIYRIPQGQSMKPHYVFIPKQPCERFDLRVRFNTKHLPSAVWRLDETFHRTIDEIMPTADNGLVPDQVGDVHEVFRNLQAGYGYGIAWTPTPGAAT